jgi:hypothetical protein
MDEAEKVLELARRKGIDPSQFTGTGETAS